MVSAPPVFQFDCPSCLRRLATDLAGRGALQRCPGCAAEFPAPEFHAAGALPAHRAGGAYAVHCPSCGTRRSVDAAGAGAWCACGACGGRFRQPEPSWERWRRPVARVLPCDDLRTSSSAAGAPRLPGTRDRLTPARHVFEYYCGACGVLQRASIWHIALPVRCGVCAARLVVPPPRRMRRLRQLDAPASPPQAVTGLFCPQCGGHLPDADRTRHEAAHCWRCALWF